MKRLICAAAGLAMMFASTFASAADVTEHQWVRLSPQGSVKGRVVVPRSEGITAARGAKVLLIEQSGKAAASPVLADQTGRFTVNGVQPGVYTLMIQGEGAFAMCAMHVVRPDVAINDHFEIAAGAVEPRIVRQAMMRYMPATLPERIAFDPSSNPLATDRAISGETVRVMQVGGGLSGRLTQAGFSEHLGLAGANVLIYREGVEVARTLTDESGNFSVADLPPGSYSVLGSGAAGFGLMGLELVDPSASQTADSDATDASLVAQVPAAPETFVMQVAPYSGPIEVIDDRLVDERDLGPVAPFDGSPAGFGGGSVGGGGGGIGGGGGGIGGGGGLLMAGGVATAIALAASDDDDGVVVPPVTSPASPVTP